jgi:hypothetical protein
MADNSGHHETRLDSWVVKIRVVKGNRLLRLWKKAKVRKTSGTEPDAVALLTRLAGTVLVKEPQRIFPGLTWTGLDVGGPCLGAFGMISENSSPL